MNSIRMQLEARGIGRLARDQSNWLLRDVSLDVHGGERVAIVGATGSGKSLLLRSMALLDRIDEGQIFWLRHSIAARSVPSFRRQVIYLHQRPALIEGTVEENLRLPFSFGICGGEQFDQQRVVDLLSSVGRGTDFLTRSSRDLSGGEAQIVALVRALQLNPHILLLDEPTASLDMATTQIIEQLVSHWHQEGIDERAMVWVTHHQEQSARVADRVVEMKAGRLIGEV